jgi:hypothetical protein
MQLYKPAIQNQNTVSYIHTCTYRDEVCIYFFFWGAGKQYYNDTEQRVKAQVYNVVGATASRLQKQQIRQQNAIQLIGNVISLQPNNMAAHDWLIAKHQIRRIRTIDV